MKKPSTYYCAECGKKGMLLDESLKHNCNNGVMNMREEPRHHYKKYKPSSGTLLNILFYVIDQSKSPSDTIVNKLGYLSDGELLDTRDVKFLMKEYGRRTKA